MRANDTSGTLKTFHCHLAYEYEDQHKIAWKTVYTLTNVTHISSFSATKDLQMNNLRRHIQI